MSDNVLNPKYRRRPGNAVLLSLIMAGLGHIYVGKFVRGLLLAFLAGIALPVTMVALSVSSASDWSKVLIVSAATSISIWLFSIIDSWRLARHTRSDYQLKDYNHWYVYILIILMSTGSSVQMAFHVRQKYFEAFFVPAGSMYPTIIPGDRILANKTAYNRADFQIGDLAIFIAPDKPQIKYIKRIVALPGDTVEIKDGELFINDQKLPRSALPDWTLAPIEAHYSDGPLKGQLMQGKVFYEDNGRIRYKIMLSPDFSPELVDMEKITIPLHHCFMLGDNRNQSHDSRHFGPVPLATIVGRVDYLYFPAKDWSRFGRINGQ